jgi:transposase
MYPLLTNDRSLTGHQVLDAHKRQPVIEKRFEQAKTVFEVAPVFLKNEGRIEGLFFLYFVALLVQALIERELRLAMKKQGIDELPIYAEERPSRRPTTEQVFRLFALTSRHLLLSRAGNSVIQVFEPEFTDLQKQVLGLIGLQPTSYHPPSPAA